MSMIKIIEETTEIVGKSLNNLSPLVGLYLRLFIAHFFFTSALTKLSNWEQTVFLFTYEYTVPLLSPWWAAAAGTVAEVLFPILLVLGFATRYAAIALFVFNVVAVYSYEFLWTDQGYNGYMQHVYYGTMLLVPIFYGPTKLTLDYYIAKYVKKHFK